MASLKVLFPHLAEEILFPVECCLYSQQLDMMKGNIKGVRMKKTTVVIAILALVVITWGGYSIMYNLPYWVAGGPNGIGLGAMNTAGHIHLHFVNETNYDELSTKLTIDAGLAYPGWRDGGQLSHPFGGKVEVVPTYMRTFEIRLLDFPKNRCAEVVRLNGDWDNASCANGDLIFRYK